MFKIKNIIYMLYIVVCFNVFSACTKSNFVQVDVSFNETKNLSAHVRHTGKSYKNFFSNNNYELETYNNKFKDYGNHKIIIVTIKGNIYNIQNFNATPVLLRDNAQPKKLSSSESPNAFIDTIKININLPKNTSIIEIEDDFCTTSYNRIASYDFAKFDLDSFSFHHPYLINKSFNCDNSSWKINGRSNPLKDDIFESYTFIKLIDDNNNILDSFYINFIYGIYII